jgi:hypothetical protein
MIFKTILLPLFRLDCTLTVKEKTLLFCTNKKVFKLGPDVNPFIFLFATGEYQLAIFWMYKLTLKKFSSCWRIMMKEWCALGPLEELFYYIYMYIYRKHTKESQKLPSSHSFFNTTFGPISDC